MKTLKEHVTEVLINENIDPALHKDMHDHAYQTLNDIHYDLENGIGHGNGVYHAAVGFVSDSLYDKFRDHPNFKPEHASRVAKDVVGGSEVDDREEYNRRNKARASAYKRREAAANRAPRVPKPKPQKATEPAKPVWVSTSSGMKLKTMKLPPFRKA
jgi:hypothetical protein